MQTTYWIIPLAITLWMSLWVYLGVRSGGVIVGQMRGVGAVFLSAAVWLIWWLMDGVRYTYS